MTSRARDQNRHRRSEDFAPRPSDLLADRLRVLAEWAVRRGATIEIEGRRWGAEDLTRLAAEQAESERELQERWTSFRRFYEEYGAAREQREKLLFAAIAELEKLREDVDARRTARFCKLRKPPLAKVRTLPPLARATGT